MRLIRLPPCKAQEPYPCLLNDKHLRFINGGVLFQALTSTVNKTFIVGIAGAVLCGGVYLAYQSAGPKLPVVAEKSTSRSAVTKLHSDSRVPAARSELASPLSVGAPHATSESPIPDAAGKQSILDAIQLASVSYDPSELPRIHPYLTHPDPELREAALNGIIVLGHAAGAPLLRDAARRTANPLEAAELLKKADYLELPSAPIELLRQRLKSRPSNGKSQTGK